VSTIEAFETGDVAPERRLAYWNDVSDRRYAGSYFEPRVADFQGKMWSWNVGQLALLRARTQPCRVDRRPLHSGEERVILHLQCRGSGRYRQGGKTAELKPGDFVLCSPHEAYGIDLAGHETLAIECPRRPLEKRFAELDASFMKPVRGASPSVRMFHDFLLSLWRQGYLEAHHPSWETELSEVFFDMAAMALRGAEFFTDVRPERAPVSSICAIIEARLQDPDLCSASIAAEAGVSVRTVQKLFAAMGTTPSAHILDERLQRAAERLLVAPEISITEIAFELGFNDSAYFTRCFRRRYGASPREWRLRK
jgi:AraC-like DNA-binding protein